MRSPIWLRLISDVPPAIDSPRCPSTIEPGHRRRAVHEGPVGADQLGADGGRLVADLGQHELGDVAFGPGLSPGDGAVGAAQVEHGHRLLVGDVATDPSGPAREPLGVGVEHRDQHVAGHGHAALAAADADALVAQGRPSDRPAAVDRPDDVVVGDEARR